MASVDSQFIAALQTGDVATLKECLRRNPEYLQEAFTWDGGSGFALNCAAAYNQPEVIKLLVKEYHASVNRREGVNGAWAPLHHARNKKAYAAAAALLLLGAEPGLRNSQNEDAVSFCNSAEVQAMADPLYQEKIRQKEQALREEKAAGTWTRTSPREVVHDYEFPDNGCRLIDIFNFETRCWRAIVKDPEAKTMTQNIMLFDGMADREVLRPALRKLKELGGAADEEELDSIRMQKNAPPRLRPAS